MNINTYDWSSKYYDKVLNSSVIEEDIDFYKSYLTKDSKVLEVGCGTGRVSLNICNLCKIVDGIDLSESMLSVFRSKLNGINNINIYKMNMIDYKINESYDLIIFPFRSFQSLTSPDDKIKCLINTFTHLKENGTIIIQMFNPIDSYLQNYHLMNKYDNEYYDIDNNMIIKRYSIGVSCDMKKQIIKSIYRFKVIQNDKIINEIDEPLELGYMYYEQFLEMINKLNMRITNTYKSWDKKIYDNEKKEMIFEIRKSGQQAGGANS